MTKSLPLLSLVAASCVGMLRMDALADSPKPTAKPAQPIDAWGQYWRKFQVSPPPPRNFMEGEFNGRVLNLTDGLLSDATAREWALAHLRRVRADIWAQKNLRLDVIDALNLGFPGRDGLADLIRKEKAKGVVRIIGSSGIEVVAMAVVHWPDDTPPVMALEHPAYAVAMFQRLATPTLRRIYKDGRDLPIDMKWEGTEARRVDLGKYMNNPVVGPIWYHTGGFNCGPDNPEVEASVCARLKL